MSAHHHTPESRAASAERARKLWADPEYRARHTARLRAQGPKARAAAIGARKKLLPERGTPEWRLYEKLRRALGVAAARATL